MGANAGNAASAPRHRHRAHPTTSAAGRPRDPTIDARIRQAARTLYGREGWAGFHFDGVAKAAGVSKDAVYRRYADTQSLLLDVLQHQNMPALDDGKPIETALIDYARDIFLYFAGRDGQANLRVHTDGDRHPDLLQAYRIQVVEPATLRDAQVLQRAQDTGQLDPDASCQAVQMALAGAAMIYALASPPSAAEALNDGDPTVLGPLADVVQQILHGKVGQVRRSEKQPRIRGRRGNARA